MRKVKYVYNKQTLHFEKFTVKWYVYVLRFLGFISLSFVFGVALVIVAYNYVDSPKEKQLKREIAAMKLQYELLNEKLAQMSEVLKGLEERDDNIYRVIFEAEAIPQSIRNAGTGGSYKYKELKNYENSELMIDITEKVDKLAKKMYIQSKSYDEITKLIREKETMLASIPAIQPISNKDLKRFASGYGMRIHPVYKTPMMHWGVDFTAPVGTEIYCTGNGKVVDINFERRGLGYHVVVDHGYGYQTVYAHMSKVKVKKGQKVNRGEVLGYVGNTGTSTGPHLHYEVVKNGKRINPINFFYNDLTPEEYEKMIEISSANNQSFD
jgi:murein DD-endopeptidase MepM/ murein hydrolase activator NlpD